MIFMLTLLALPVVLILFRLMKFIVYLYCAKLRMQKYNRFVKAEYDVPESIPGLILRIQNEYIDEYNRLAESNLGCLCKIRSYKRDAT